MSQRTCPLDGDAAATDVDDDRCPKAGGIITQNSQCVAEFHQSTVVILAVTIVSSAPRKARASDALRMRTHSSSHNPNVFFDRVHGERKRRATI